MKVGTTVCPDGDVVLTISGETDHENSLVTLISQKAFDGAHVAEAHSIESSQTSMVLRYRNPGPIKPAKKQPKK